jgi:3-phenylpropionate/trans-cinnamate dioxygenase ferredoxin reductase subunit
VSEIERTDVLLVGGGVASVRCARALRRNGFTGSIRLVGLEPVLPYNRPPLSKELLRDDLPDDLVMAEPASWYARRSVSLGTGTTVVELDPDAHVANLDDGSSVGFAQCLIATGAEPRTLPIDGNEHAILLRTLPDARRLRAAAMAAGKGAPVTVIGGGFIGVEVASALASLGLRPTVVEMADALWGGTLGPSLAEWGAAQLEAAGVQLRLEAAVTRLDAQSAWIGDEQLAHELAVAGIGVIPRVDQARRAGLEVDDGIVTDREQRTSHPAVWAAGDVARFGSRRVEHWHAARESGERAALSMLGLPVPQPPAPWLFTEVAGIPLDVIGAAEEWDEERWVREASVLAYLQSGRIVQLAVIDSALDPGSVRRLVEANASVRELQEALAN